MTESRTQSYIGVPNGVVLCIDERHGNEYIGYYYHAYDREGIRIITLEEMIFSLESFFDTINYPHSTTNNRSFKENPIYIQSYQEKKRVMTDEELLRKHGDLGSFIIRVQHRQNSSWQGMITWVEEDKTLRFRSTFELVKLIESALNSADESEAEEEQPNW